LWLKGRLMVGPTGGHFPGVPAKRHGPWESPRAAVGHDGSGPCRWADRPGLPASSALRQLRGLFQFYGHRASSRGLRRAFQERPFPSGGAPPKILAPTGPLGGDCFSAMGRAQSRLPPHEHPVIGRNRSPGTLPAPLSVAGKWVLGRAVVAGGGGGRWGGPLGRGRSVGRVSVPAALRGVTGPQRLMVRSDPKWSRNHRRRHRSAVIVRHASVAFPLPWRAR